jgi:hypothetical protein
VSRAVADMAQLTAAVLIEPGTAQIDGDCAMEPAGIASSR